MARATKAERRCRRKRDRWSRGRWTVQFRESEQPLGPGVVSASPQEVLAAIHAMPDLEWPAVAPLVLPLLERVRPYPVGHPERATVFMPPGLSIGFGIDIGPAHMIISREMVGGWGISLADVAARALGNLHAIAAEVESDKMVVGPLGDYEAACLQTDRHIGSVMPLAPTELQRLFGDEPRVFITPMRDLIIGLPHDVDRDWATWLYAEIASGDPNCMPPFAFLFDGRQVVVDRLALPAAVA
jgi:hypothetical protein